MRRSLHSPSRGRWSISLISWMLLLASFLLPSAASAQITITLKDPFIERFKNRVTIDARFTVDKAHEKPNPPSKDGDLHVAGRAPEIGLATVAEIMNAGSEQEAVDAFHAAEGTGEATGMTGVWRIWCEHGGNDDQIQGKPLKPFTTTNPHHVFQIHPITKLGALSLLRSLKPIADYTYKRAEDAFFRYESVRSEIAVDSAKKTTTISTTGVGFNYVEFIMELEEDDHLVVEDGRFVRSSVLALDGDLLVRNRRMVFVQGSGSEEMVRPLKKGAKMHVVGIPRINLALVSWRARNGQQRPEVLRWNLPYEIIIVAAIKIAPEEAGAANACGVHPALLRSPERWPTSITRKLISNEFSVFENGIIP